MHQLDDENLQMCKNREFFSSMLSLEMIESMNV